MDIVLEFLKYSGFANVTWGHIIMILAGGVCIYLGIAKNYEPLLLIPIGFGIIIGNIPFLESAGCKLESMKMAQ